MINMNNENKKSSLNKAISRAKTIKNLKNQGAIEMTNQRKNEAEALLKIIQDKLAKSYKTDSPDFNYGHAGNLGHVVEKLKEINEFLK